MRFPVENSYSKVIVSESLEIIIIIIIFANISNLPYMASYLTIYDKLTKFGSTNPFRFILDAVFDSESNGAIFKYPSVMLALLDNLT